MRPSQFSQLGALALLTLASAAVRAEDIDIYQGTSGGGIPNMLIILDNAAAASASSSFTCPSLTVNDPNKNLGFEQCGLHSAVSKIGSNAALNGNINLGLMYFPGAPPTAAPSSSPHHRRRPARCFSWRAPAPTTARTSARCSGASRR